MCHTHVGSTEKNFLSQKKTCLSICPLPRQLHHPNTQQPQCFPTSPTMNLNTAAPVSSLSSPRTRVPASFASFVFAHNASYAPPSQHNPLHTTLGQKTTQALPNDDAVTDATTHGQKRNGRDLTVRAERSTLGLRPSHLGKLSLPAHSNRAVTSRWPKMTRNRQCGPTLRLRRFVDACGEKRHHHVLVAVAAGKQERCLSRLRGLVHVGSLWRLWSGSRLPRKPADMPTLKYSLESCRAAKGCRVASVIASFLERSTRTSLGHSHKVTSRKRRQCARRGPRRFISWMFFAGPIFARKV